MKIIGLDGREYNLKLRVRSGGQCSKGHLIARQLLNELFPNYQIYEEVTLPGSTKRGRSHPLYADFLIPQLKIIVEVQGVQHTNFTPHFHSNKLEFLQAKKRDSEKREWAEINNFSFIELNYDEQSKWRERIVSGI